MTKILPQILITLVRMKIIKMEFLIKINKL